MYKEATRLSSWPRLKHDELLSNCVCVFDVCHYMTGNHDVIIVYASFGGFVKHVRRYDSLARYFPGRGIIANHGRAVQVDLGLAWVDRAWFQRMKLQYVELWKRGGTIT